MMGNIAWETKRRGRFSPERRMHSYAGVVFVILHTLPIVPWLASPAVWLDQVGPTLSSFSTQRGSMIRKAPRLRRAITNIILSTLICVVQVVHLDRLLCAFTMTSSCSAAECLQGLYGGPLIETWRKEVKIKLRMTYQIQEVRCDTPLHLVGQRKYSSARISNTQVFSMEM